MLLDLRNQETNNDAKRSREAIVKDQQRAQKSRNKYECARDGE